VSHFPLALAIVIGGLIVGGIIYEVSANSKRVDEIGLECIRAGGTWVAGYQLCLRGSVK